MNIKKYYNIGKKELFPICRSLTGSGTLKTLKIIKKKFPKIKIKSIKSGTKAFDWKVPPEWNVVDAFVLDKNKNKIIDFKINNLHLVGYSLPINKYIKKKELLDHLHSIPKLPDAIPQPAVGVPPYARADTHAQYWPRWYLASSHAGR